MILTASTSLEISLGATVTTQMSFFCHFNEKSLTYLSGTSQNGVTNNTTWTTMVSAPLANFQREIREVFIKNDNNIPTKVSIRFTTTTSNSTIFSATLQTGYTLSYNIESGWKTYDQNGLLSINTTHINPISSVITTGLYITSGVTISRTLGLTGTCQYIGKAEKDYSSIKILYRISTAAASITWAEIGVYKITMPFMQGSQINTQRLGYADCSSVWNNTGISATTISLSDCYEGDDLYVTFSNTATTSVALTNGWVDDMNSANLNSYFFPITGGGDGRPSVNFNFRPNDFGNQGANFTPTILLWQGT